MSALVIVQAAFLVLRFFLAPRVPALRFLPFNDETALYLHRWLIALTAVGSFGILTCGFIRLAGASELEHFQAITLVSLMMAAMIIWMILQKRKAAAALISDGLPESSLRYRVAQKWHHFAILAVVLLLFFSAVNQILGFASGQGTLTLLMVPLFFLLDWILRLIMEAAFGIVREKKTQPVPAVASSAGARDDGVLEAAAPAATESPEAKPAQGGRLELNRMKGPLRTALRLALVALLLFWTLDIWGISLQIGETVVRGVLEIIVVVLVCYVAWGIINAAILRRMRREMPDAEADDEKEEGGAGGSRIGTLLHLLRYDADVENIRKVIKKKVYQKIAEDPELGPKLLEPIKSQGVREMDDSAMIMRVKYKTKPGDQFAIRKEVYRLMQEAFKEEGIEFAHRNVTVYLPPEPGRKATAQPEGEDRQDDAKANGNIRRQASAAAALAAIQDEEAEKQPQK